VGHSNARREWPDSPTFATQNNRRNRKLSSPVAPRTLEGTDLRVRPKRFDLRDPRPYKAAFEFSGLRAVRARVLHVRIAGFRVSPNGAVR